MASSPKIALRQSNLVHDSEMSLEIVDVFALSCFHEGGAVAIHRVKAGLKKIESE